MFICTPCLNKTYTNDESYGKSFGTCEVCADIMLCNNISHSRLEFKDKAVFAVHTPTGVNVEVARRVNGKYEFTNQLTVMLDDRTPVIVNVGGDAMGIQTIGGIREAALRQIADEINKEFFLKPEL